MPRFAASDQDLHCSYYTPKRSIWSKKGYRREVTSGISPNPVMMLNEHQCNVLMLH